jgi:cathepsin D
MAVSKFPADGRLGLAFPSFSHFHGQSPLFHTLYNEGKLPQPVFSLKLTSSGGELYVGGTNEAFYIHSTLVFTPVINSAVSANARRYGCILKFPSQVLWKVKIDNIQVDGVPLLTDVTAVIDTGAHLIIGDQPRVLALHLAAGGGEDVKRPGIYYTCEFRSILVLLIDSL